MEPKYKKLNQTLRLTQLIVEKRRIALDAALEDASFIHDKILKIRYKCEYEWNYNVEPCIQNEDGEYYDNVCVVVVRTCPLCGKVEKTDIQVFDFCESGNQFDS